MRPAIDLVGQTFGALTVIGRGPRRYLDCTNAMWLCRCRCGRVTNVISPALRGGRSRSCGAVGCRRRKAGVL